MTLDIVDAAFEFDPVQIIMISSLLVRDVMQQYEILTLGCHTKEII